MINTICPYFPLSTFNSITPCSSAAGSEVTFIPFLSKTSSGLDEQKGEIRSQPGKSPNVFQCMMFHLLHKYHPLL